MSHTRGGRAGRARLFFGDARDVRRPPLARLAPTHSFISLFFSHLLAHSLLTQPQQVHHRIHCLVVYFAYSLLFAFIHSLSSLSRLTSSVSCDSPLFPFVHTSFFVVCSNTLIALSVRLVAYVSHIIRDVHMLVSHTIGVCTRSSVTPPRGRALRRCLSATPSGCARQPHHFGVCSIVSPRVTMCFLCVLCCVYE